MTQQTTKPSARKHNGRPVPSDHAGSPNGEPSPTNGDAALRPQVTLYVSGSDESRSVFELLDGAGVDFRAVASRRPVPLATFGRLRFMGLDEARELVTLLHDLDAAWRAEAEQVMPDILRAPEPRLMTDVENTRARWRQQARAVLARVSAAPAEQSGLHRPLARARSTRSS